MGCVFPVQWPAQEDAVLQRRIATAEADAPRRRAEANARLAAHSEAEGQRKAAREAGDLHIATSSAVSSASPYKGSPYKDFDDTKFVDLLLTESLAVVKMEYFEECYKKKQVFQDRAGIPGKAFYTGVEALELWKEHGHGFLVIISYAWLSKHHPDPQRFHLRRLVTILRNFKTYHRCRGEVLGNLLGGRAAGKSTQGQVGVILDYCSLWQKRPDGTGKMTRGTAEQEQQFRDGLTEINTPYGHEEITAIKLRAVPAEECRKYDDRGWTLFESIIIDSKGNAPTGCNYGHMNYLAIDDSFNPDAGAQNIGVKQVFSALTFMQGLVTSSRTPPQTPEAFGEEMRKRGNRAKAKNVNLFTNGSDQPFIMKKYEDAFNELVKTKKLFYDGPASTTWSKDDIQNFLQALPHFTVLEELGLHGVGQYMNEDERNALIERIAEMLQKPDCSLSKLDLAANQLSDANAKALVAALRPTSVLKKLIICDNDIAEASMDCLRTAWGDRAPEQALAFGMEQFKAEGIFLRRTK